MIPTIPDGTSKERDGISVPTKEAFTFTKKEGVEYLKYLCGPKDDHDIIDPYVRTRHIKTNFDNTQLPVYGTETFKKDLDNYSEAVMEKFVQRQKYFKSLKQRRSNKTDKEPLFMEIIVALKDEEIQGLNETQIVERLYECGERLVKGFTEKATINNDILMKPHLKYDPKRPGKLMPDMHILIGYYDRDGNALKLGNDGTGYKKLGRIHHEMEQEKKFSYLLKTRTEAWEKQGMLLPKSKIDLVTNKIDEIIQQYENKPALLHRALKDAGFVLEPQRKGKDIKYIDIRYKGENYRTNNENFNSATTTALRNYLEQKEFEENYPKVKDTEFGTFHHLHTQINAIFKRYEGKDLEELTNALLAKGVVATPYIKKNTFSGFTFTLPMKDKEKKFIDLKARNLGFDFNKYSFNEDSIERILEKAKNYKDEKYLALDKDDNIVIGGEIFKVDQFGNLIKVEKSNNERKKEFVQWMKWLKNDNESLPEFQNRMLLSANNRLTFLSSAYFEGEDYTVAKSKWNNKVMFTLLDSGGIRIHQNNTSSIKSALQAYAAMNQLSDEDKKFGYKPAISFNDSTRTDMRDKIWLEARLMGFVVQDYEPAAEVRKQYEDKLNEKLQVHRKENMKRLLKHSLLPPEQQFKRRLTISYNKAVENDVDRRAVALAFVDAFTLGVNLDLLRNPPKTHADNRSKVFEHDLMTHRELMLKEIENKCPERIDEFLAILDGSEGFGSPENDDIKNKKKTKPKI